MSQVFRPLSGRILSCVRLSSQILDVRRLSVCSRFSRDFSHAPRAPWWCAAWSPMRSGKPVAGAACNSSRDRRPWPSASPDPDGSYEIRSTESGRFRSADLSARSTPGIGQDFYGGSTDEMTQNIVLEVGSVHADVTVTATGMPTPVQQSSSPQSR